jgi:hypothetical protein
MTIEPDVLRYLGIYEEPAGSYQTDHTGTPADFLALPYEEGTLQAQLGRAALDPMAGKIRRDGHSKKVLGPRSCTLNVATKIHSHGVDCDGDVDVPTKSTWALARVLEAIMGGSLADGGTTATSSAQTTVQSSTTTTITVDTGHGARFAVGGVIAAPTVSGSPHLEARPIESISTDTITVKHAFSAAPVTGQPVRGGLTIYMKEDPDTSLQALIEGREGSDGVGLRGLQGGFSLSMPLGELGQFAFALQGAGWARLGSSSATNPSYGVFEPVAMDPLELLVPVLGTTTRRVVEQSELSIEPQIAYAPQRSGAAEETIARMVRQPARPLVSGSFVCPYEDDTWYTRRDNRTALAVWAQAGKLAGGIFVVDVPTVQVTDVQPAASGEGIAGQRVSFEGRHDETIGGATEIGYSALRLHFV